MKRVGVIGTFVWDIIYGRDPRDLPVQEWGGITYALGAFDAALPPDWQVVPLVKVGSDLAPRAREFLRTLRRVAPDATPIEAESGLLVFDPHVARAQSQVEPPIRQEIHSRRLPREQDGMAQIVVEHVGADPEAFRRGRGAHDGRDGGQHGGQVIGYQQRGIAGRFDLAGLVLPRGPRRGIADVDAEAERVQCITDPPSTFHACPVM